MAHIADFMVHTSNSVGLNNYIAREISPHSPHENTTNIPSGEETEKYVWRMHQPTEPRKYQLFPGLEKLCMNNGRKSPDSETALSMANGQSSLASNGPRKPKEQTLVRRRKVSVPELGPMTTVQEIAMDSPTIPGRPPLHERSISAPGNTWRQHVFGESMLSCISGPALDEQAELAISSGSTTPTTTQGNSSSESLTHQQTSSKSTSISSRPSSPRQPLSPKTLTPLVIPIGRPRIVHHSSTSRLRTDALRPEVPPKSARSKEGSPYPRSSPFTPMSSISLPIQTPTPHSAPEGRSSPKPWISSSTSHSRSPLGHSRGQSESQQRPSYRSESPQEHSRAQSDTTPPFLAPHIQHRLGHRRGESEGSNSVMDRGRPTRRPDIPGSAAAPSINYSTSKRSPSAEEQRAFECLPAGVNATRANGILSPTEVDILRTQAIGQACRFEVLTSKDVDGLSRELRALDERCEYLRKTHRSLRSGRRNLHDRICSYLRSPRVARFSHESILKQEEALSELDRSIDDWVSKLEQAENRRTRIRQKLLEHVAGALIMQPSSSHQQSTPNSILNHPIQKTIAIPPSGENTPPRSPTKLSPLRESERVVSEVRITSPEKPTRRDVESIRIYADSDVYALLADVEQEITRMGELDAADAAEAEKNEIISPALPVVVDAGAVTLSALTFEALPARTYTPPVPQRG